MCHDADRHTAGFTQICLGVFTYIVMLHAFEHGYSKYVQFLCQIFMMHFLFVSLHVCFSLLLLIGFLGLFFFFCIGERN